MHVLFYYFHLLDVCAFIESCVIGVVSCFMSLILTSDPNSFLFILHH